MELVLKDEPLSCLYCGSTQIQAGHFDPEAYSREVVCLHCKGSWLEVFHFDSVVIPPEMEETYLRYQEGTSYA